MTDSGGIQEETTALGMPCFTIRENTERPVTIEEGTNALVGTTAGGILSASRFSRMAVPKKAESQSFRTAEPHSGSSVFCYASQVEASIN